MPLDAIDEEDSVATRGGSVNPRIKAFCRGPKRNHIERAYDGAPDRRFGDAVVRKNGNLSVDRPAPMASHGGHDEGVDTQSAEIPNGGANNIGDVGDPAASHADRNARARTQRGPQFLRCEFLSNCPGYIRERVVLEALSDR